MADDDSEDEAFQAEIAAREAFEARFPPEAFEPIVRALNLVTTPENVSAIRGWLMPYLEQSFSGNAVKKSAVSERRKELRRLHVALALVSRASRRARGAGSLPWSLGTSATQYPRNSLPRFSGCTVEWASSCTN